MGEFCSFYGMDENYKEEGLKKILAKKVKKLIFKVAIGRVKRGQCFKIFRSESRFCRVGVIVIAIPQLPLN